jgi:hypothetical protein
MEFNEGICSKALRDYFADVSEDLKLLLFDGPVDTLWIENMNSVLDDTKKLCLENSDQIRLDEKTFIIFEIDDLSQASLATISRCGMVYTDRVNIEPNDFFYSWLDTLPDSYIKSDFKDCIIALFNSYYHQIVDDHLFDEYNNLIVKMGLPIFKNWFMQIFINVLECLLFDSISKEETIENEIEKERMKENNEGDNQIGVKEVEKDKGNTNRHLSEREKQVLFNKFIYCLMISFIWLLDSNKEQQLIISKIAEINKINVKDQNYPLNSHHKSH